MRKQFPFLLSAILMTSFACQKERKEQEIPEVVDKPEQPVAKKVAVATIASVQMLQDCPDPKPASPRPETPAKEAEDAPASVLPYDETAPVKRAPPSDRTAEYTAPCQQSTMQLHFAGQGSESATVVIKGVQLLTADGKELGPLATRVPTMWNGSVYAPWDQVLQPASDVEASYKLRPPNWSDVESKIEGPSHGKMFMLEATIEVGGQTQVVRSTAFARIQPEMVPT